MSKTYASMTGGEVDALALMAITLKRGMDRGHLVAAVVGEAPPGYLEGVRAMAAGVQREMNQLLKDWVGSLLAAAQSPRLRISITYGDGMVVSIKDAISAYTGDDVATMELKAMLTGGGADAEDGETVH